MVRNRRQLTMIRIQPRFLLAGRQARGSLSDKLSYCKSGTLTTPYQSRSVSAGNKISELCDPLRLCANRKLEILKKLVRAKTQRTAKLERLRLTSMWAL